MQYVISFLEGIITFISPCLLPMLPIYTLTSQAVESAAQERLLQEPLALWLVLPLFL